MGWISSRADKCLRHLRTCTLQPLDVRHRAGLRGTDQSRSHTPPTVMPPEPAPSVHTGGEIQQVAGPSGQSNFTHGPSDEPSDASDWNTQGGGPQLSPAPCNPAAPLSHNDPWYPGWVFVPPMTPDMVPQADDYHPDVFCHEGLMAPCGPEEGVSIANVSPEVVMIHTCMLTKTQAYYDANSNYWQGFDHYFSQF